MTRICLDTSAYTHFMCGEPTVVGLVKQAREVLVPVVVLGELRAGFRLGARTEQSETELRQFLESPFVRVLELDEEAAALYADLAVELRRTGMVMPTNDLWIASLAVREGARLVTFDERFSRIRRVGAHVIRKADPPTESAAG